MQAAKAIEALRKLLPSTCDQRLGQICLQSLSGNITTKKARPGPSAGWIVPALVHVYALVLSQLGEGGTGVLDTRQKDRT